MRTIKLLTLFSFFFALCAGAQTTSVTGTMVDSDSTAWAGATWTLSFVPSPQHPNISVYNIGGVPLDPNVINQAGTSDGSGVLSFSTYQIGAISPNGAQFQLQLCPKASVSCSSLVFSTGSNSSLSLTSAMESNFKAPRFQAIPGAYGYIDGEAILQLTIGNQYFNVTSNLLRLWTGSAWISVGGSGGITQLTGDVTAGPGSGSQAATLATVNGTPGTCGDSTHVCQSTTNIKGLTTNQTQVAIAGGGSIIPPNPSNTIYAVIGDSRNLSSTADTTTYTVSAVSYASTVVTLTATNNLKAGDWVGADGITSPACLTSQNPYIFQVLASGLSTSQFKINVPACTGSGTGTGGTVSFRSYDWPEAMANKPFFAGNGSVLNFNPVDGENISGIITLYNTVVHPIMAAALGKKYLIIQTGYDDFVIANSGCVVTALPAFETSLQGLASIAHADGVQVIFSTNPANSHDSDGGSCSDSSFWQIFNLYNMWVKGQGPQLLYTGSQSTSGSTGAADTHLNVSSTSGILLGDLITGPDIAAGTYVTSLNGGTSPIVMSAVATGGTSGTYVFSHGQHWDYMFDFASAFGGAREGASTPPAPGPYQMPNSYLFTNLSNPPHFSDGGNELISEIGNATLMNGGLTLKFGCNSSDGCANMWISNTWIANPQVNSGAPNMTQFISLPDYAGNNPFGFWGVGDFKGDTCIMMGYISIIPIIGIGVEPGSPCDSIVPYLFFKPVTGGISTDMQINGVYGWSTGGSFDSIDTGFSKIGPKEIGVGNGAQANVGGSLDMDHLKLTNYYDAGNPLPTCTSGISGSQNLVDDATSPTYLGTYASGGAVKTPVFCNGTNWITY